MSRFYGDLKGNRGEATRGGSKASGISGHIKGWHIGARVTVYADSDDTDTVRIFLTGGSGSPGTILDLGDWQLRNGQPVKVV